MALPKPRQSYEDGLIARHVELRSPLDTPDKARLAESGVRVATVIQQLRDAGRDIADVAESYHLSEEAVHAAIAYYERHKPILDARITLNDAWATGEGAMHDEMVIPIPVRSPEPILVHWEPKTDEERFIARYVETATSYPTAEVARLRESGVSVTTVIQQLRDAGRDIADVAESYRLSQEAIRAAIAYYERHKAVIDARIMLNMAWATDEGWS
ncbi:MAG: DUF433 domain-containing protein [Thermomicrobiales bacterium]